MYIKGGRLTTADREKLFQKREPEAGKHLLETETVTEPKGKHFIQKQKFRRRKGQPEIQVVDEGEEY